MARLLHGCLFILQIRQWYWTWKAFLSIKNYFYQHQNITIIIKGECETCPISEIAIIILSLKFIGLFEAAAFSFTTLFLLPSCFSLLYSGRSPCCLSHFPPTASRKKRAATKMLFALSAMWNTKGWLKIMHVNFARRRTEVNFPSTDWLSYLRTQLTVFVGGVCLFSALFFRNNFFTRRGHFKELWVNRNLFDCSEIWTVASLTYKQPKCVWEFSISKYFFWEGFLYSHSIFF